LLVVNCKELPNQLTEGGTGSSSLLYSQPDVLPDKYESGTLNLSGINGLSAGIDFVKTRGIINIENREMNFIRYIYDEIKKTKNIELYTNRPTKNNYVPLLSFNIKDMDCNDVSFYLDQKYNIATRSGLHCSPLAHKTYNTENLGTVRICPSVFTDVNSVNTLLFAIKSLIK